MHPSRFIFGENFPDIIICFERRKTDTESMADFDFERLLIVNTFGIGDVLFTTPVMANIKHHCPDIRLGYVANARTAELLKHHPLVDDIFVYERDDFSKLYRRSRVEFLREAEAFLSRIRERQYDAVLDFSMNMPTGFLMKMAGIPRRIGFDYKGAGPIFDTAHSLKRV